MKILYFGTNYSEIYELWRAHLHYKDILLAASTAQARFYFENQQISLMIINHEFTAIQDLIDWDIIPSNTPIIIINKDASWFDDIRRRLQPKLCPTSYVSISNPKDIVDLVQLKELHGMCYVASPVHDNMEHDKTPS